MKKIIAVVLTLVLCLSLCSCKGKKSDAKKITISHCQGEWCWPVLDQIADEFKKETGIEVEFLYVASESYDKWREAQLAAGSEPDIIWGMTNAKTFYSNGKIMPLTKYYNEVSPFSGQPWKDDYIDGILDNCYDENGEELITNLLSRAQINLYYNKDIFKELNLEVPDSWSDFIKAAQVAKDAGYIPFSAMNSSTWTLEWMEDPVLEDCYANSGLVKKLDVITKNGILDENEVLLGAKAGLMKFTDPEFVTYFKLVKDLVPYYNVGFNSASWEFESLFNDGKAAMTLNGSWYPNQHMINDLSVNYGVAMIPYVDAAIYKDSRNERVKYMVSPPAGDIVVTKRAEKEGRAESAVKFLQYISNAKGGGKLWTDKTMFLPVIKNVEMPEVMKPFEEFGGTTPMVYSASRLIHIDPEAHTAYRKIFSDYLENDQTAEDFAKQVQALYSKYIDDVIELSSVDIEAYLDKIK